MISETRYLALGVDTLGNGCRRSNETFANVLRLTCGNENVYFCKTFN